MRRVHSVITGLIPGTHDGRLSRRALRRDPGSHGVLKYRALFRVAQPCKQTVSGFIREKRGKWKSKIKTNSKTYPMLFFVFDMYINILTLVDMFNFHRFCLFVLFC